MNPGAVPNAAQLDVASVGAAMATKGAFFLQYAPNAG
jgi:hypothetical protein